MHFKTSSRFLKKYSFLQFEKVYDNQQINCKQMLKFPEGLDKRISNVVTY